MKETLADITKRRREELGLSPKRLAARSGLPHAVISRIETGEITELVPSRLENLAHALGLTFRTLAKAQGEGRKDGIIES